MRTSEANPLIGEFGWTRTDGRGLPKPHKGVDVLCLVGWPCMAAHAGKVIRSAYSTSYGEVIYLQAGDIESRYAHLSERLIGEGEVVTHGQLIGRTGKSGNADSPFIPAHLHWEVRIGGVPVHPLRWLAGQIDPLPEMP